jgi:hypothetical protein
MYTCTVIIVYIYTADIDMSVVGAHVAHTTATLAMGGEYSQARLSALSSQRMLQRTRYHVPLLHLVVLLWNPSIKGKTPELIRTPFLFPKTVLVFFLLMVPLCIYSVCVCASSGVATHSLSFFSHNTHLL